MPTLIDQARQASRSHVPEFAVANTGAPLPTIPPSPAFLFAWHPTAWTVIDGALVPRLSKRKLQPGVNGVQRDRHGRWHIGDMRNHAEGHGWKLLPLECAPDGESYLREQETQQGPNVMTAYLSVFERAYPGSPDVDGDTAAYVAWLQDLVAKGTITPCAPFVARRLADAKRTTLAELEQQVAQGNTRLQGHVDALTAELVVLDAHAESDRKTRKATRSKKTTLDLGDS